MAIYFNNKKICVWRVKLHKCRNKQKKQLVCLPFVGGCQFSTQHKKQIYLFPLKKLVTILSTPGKRKKIMNLKVEEPLNVAVSLNSYTMLMKYCLNP